MIKVNKKYKKNKIMKKKLIKTTNIRDIYILYMYNCILGSFSFKNFKEI